VAVAGALVLLTAATLVLQFVAPVFAYETPAAADDQPLAKVVRLCAVPDRGIIVTYLLVPARRTRQTPADNYELQTAKRIATEHPAAKLATFTISVSAAGRPSRVVLTSAPAYAGMADDVRRTYMSSTYKPALRNCTPVDATITTAFRLSPQTVRILKLSRRDPSGSEPVDSNVKVHA